jgi:hypothetical protein
MQAVTILVQLWLPRCTMRSECKVVLSVRNCTPVCFCADHDGVQLRGSVSAGLLLACTAASLQLVFMPTQCNNACGVHEQVQHMASLVGLQDGRREVSFLFRQGLEGTHLYMQVLRHA